MALILALLLGSAAAFAPAPALFSPRPSRWATAKLRMGWGDDIVWGTTTIIKNKPACGGGIRSIVVEVKDGDVLTPYTVPGQFVQIKQNLDPETKAGFYAIASAPQPGSAQCELLVKKTDSNAWLCEAEAGTAWPTSPAMGKGFPIDALAADVDTVLLFAAGTGISPIKAAIESGKLDGKKVKLYYGGRRAANMAYDLLFKRWQEQHGVEVVPVLSQGGTKVRNGYVQAALKEDGVASPATTAALLCGMKGMAEAVTGILTDAVVAKERILTNF